MLELRDYQNDLLQGVNSRFDNGDKAVMAQLATGGGKTGIAATWAKQVGGNVLFLCHTLSVISQLPREADKWGLYSAAAGGTGGNWKMAMLRTRAFRSMSRFDESQKFNLLGNANLPALIACTPKTAKNNLTKPGSIGIGQFNGVIVDEAHHAADGLHGKNPTIATQIVQMAKDAGIPSLGITATPWRLSAQQGFNHTWDNLVQGEDWHSLQHTYLAHPILHTIERNYRIRGSGNKRGNDYTEQGTYLANVENPVFTKGIFPLIDRYGMNPDGRLKKTIVYAVGQVHALRLSRLAAEKGIPTGLLVSDNGISSKAHPDVETCRDTVNRQFASGDIRLVINVNMVTEGYDMPDCEVVCCLRPTLSLSLWRQMCGRGSRRTENKREVAIIDLTDNHSRLGSPLDPYDWSLLPRLQTHRGSGAITRYCTPREKHNSCGAKIFVGHHECPECSAKQGKRCISCGKFRLWNRYEGMTLFSRSMENDKPVCDFCLAAGTYSIN